MATEEKKTAKKTEAKAEVKAEMTPEEKKAAAEQEVDGLVHKAFKALNEFACFGQE